MAIDVEALALSTARIEYLEGLLGENLEEQEKLQDELAEAFKEREEILVGK